MIKALETELLVCTFHKEKIYAKMNMGKMI